jgi:putative addiction module component (TIGR02574 family)
MARAEEHIQELLKLSPEERAHAASVLLESLEPDEGDPGAEQAQADEIARRLARLADGSAVLVDGAEVRRRIAARLREVRGA